ncbi:shikimate kinase [Azospirillum sp. ST 5-10]|uniref:shikimate kinase n=1 Tax=unclassified Azospirillum TaxID=2630922 RepID=UPI003F4A585B
MSDTRHTAARLAPRPGGPAIRPLSQATPLEAVWDGSLPPCRPLPQARPAAAPEVPVGTDDRPSFLEALGERVRAARVGQGMTRKALALRSGVSERHLAQLETGHGNISVLLLRAVAQATGVALDALLRDGGPASPAGRGVALLGTTGAGRRTLGRRLAERLDLPLVVVDEEIGRDVGLAAADLLALCGPPAFAAAERRCIDDLLARHGAAVIVLSGLAAADPAAIDRLRRHGATVWVRASVEEHVRRTLPRPGDGGLRRAFAGGVADSLARRAPLDSLADLTVDTTGRDVEDCLAELVAGLGRLETHRAAS